MHPENVHKNAQRASVWQNPILYLCLSYTNCYLEIRIQLAGGNETFSLQEEALKGGKADLIGE